MKLNPKSFRIFTEESTPGEIRDMCGSPLILVKANGQISWGTQKTYKDDLLKEYDEKAGDVMLFSWSGQFTTDMFIVTAADLKKCYLSRWTTMSKIPHKNERLLKELQDLVDSL